MYDIIGDIHGHADALETLLRSLGYRYRRGAWRFPNARRHAIFVGDFIDRGPRIRDTIAIVRGMVEAESASAVAGNHEYNALAWHTRDEAGRWLRSHTDAHYAQHRATLDEYAAYAPSELTALLEWSATLPLFFENGDLRVVHAAWDDALVDLFSHDTVPLSDYSFLVNSAQSGTRENSAIEVLLKGVEISMPDGTAYVDKDGTVRRRTRARWWLDGAERRTLLSSPSGITMASVAMPPADRIAPDAPVSRQQVETLPGYDDKRPVFVGHYWLTGPPAPLDDRVACVDYSVARGGKLCAYRYDGELPLSSRQFVCVT